MAEANDVPVVYALSRKKLGRALSKNRTRVSIVGIQSFDGSMGLERKVWAKGVPVVCSNHI